MKYLIHYSNEERARKNKQPLQGSIVELNTVEDIHKFVEDLEDPIIFHPEKEQEPWWAEYDYLSDDEEREDHYRVKLPEGWEYMPWIEIYNGYRE